MSIEIMRVVWSVDIPHAKKLVLLSLADHANDSGQCFPSVSTLARRCSMNRATILRALESLESQGHITRDLRTGRSTVYHVHPSQSATSRAEQPVAECDQLQGATTPVAESDPTGRTERPHPSLSATHNPHVTIKEPSRKGRDARPRATANRLPADFELTEERRVIARAEAVDADREFANFRDHWTAASGDRARKHDWDAAWRIWCRKAADYRTSTPAHKPFTRNTAGAEVDERSKLRRLMDNRAECAWLKGFRDPNPGETAEAYAKAQDDEYKRVERERERLRPPRFITDLTARKRLST